MATWAGKARPENRIMAAPSWLAATLLFMMLALPALAQQGGEGAAGPSTCLAVADNRDLPLQWAGGRQGGESLPLRTASFSANVPLILASGRFPPVTIRYVTHSAFRIESPEGVVIVTDYNGRSGEGRLPDVVTMNHAHATHYTLNPDPRIPNVLPGWGEQGGRIDHYLQVGDVLIRNVSTDIMRGGVMIEEEGNSIFIFETAGLCIGHLGHLHHTLTDEHFARIGRLDVLMIPVDGSVTMSIEGMAALARRLRSSVILPMHWFSGFSLQRFLSEIGTVFEVEVTDGDRMQVALDTLPQSPRVIALQPELDGSFGFGFD